MMQSRIQFYLGQLQDGNNTALPPQSDEESSRQYRGGRCNGKPKEVQGFLKRRTPAARR